MRQAIEIIEDELKHSLNMMNGLKADVAKINHDVRYYEGQCDILRTTLEILKGTNPS